MPGIQQKEWKEYSSTRPTKHLTPSHEEAFVAHYREVLSEGFHKASHVRDELRISPTHWERLVTEMKDPDSLLVQRMITEHEGNVDIGLTRTGGVPYHVERTGRTQTAYLFKWSMGRTDEGDTVS